MSSQDPDKMSSAADEKSSFNGDAAVDAVDSSPAPIFEIDPAVERRVVRKLDCTVLIAFGLVFGESKRARLFFVACYRTFFGYCHPF